MPGIFGLVDSSGGAEAAAAAARVREGMRRDTRLTTEYMASPDRRWALGRIHLGVLQPDAQVTDEARPRQGTRVLFHGDLHNADELALDLERRGHGRPQGVAALVAELYRNDPGGFTAKLRGAFCAAVLDEDAGRILLISDYLGTYPVYWFHERGRFVFSSELYAALRAHPAPSLDARTVSHLVEFGFPVGEGTLAAGVSLLPPASTVTYDARQDRVTVAAYSSIASAFQPGAANRQDYVDRVSAAFAATMDRAVAGSHRYAVSLSGGLDTRVILSALDRKKVPLSTFTLGGRGCADQVIAEQLSVLAHSSHRFVPLDEQYLEDLLPSVERMTTLTDGMYLSHGFTEIRARQAFEESDFSVLLRGHAGELAKASTAWPFHTDARVHAMRTTTELTPYLAARFANGAAADVLSDRWRDTTTSARASLDELLDGVSLSPADLCSYVYLRHYHRRVTIPSLEIFRGVTEVRLPLADADFLQAVLQGAPRWRDDTSLHRAIITAFAPAYLRVRNPNTGAPAGAGPWQEFVLDKMNTVLRRLNVYGYRHYHSFDGWMRSAFMNVVRRVLLDPDTMARGVYRESSIRRRIAEAEQGQRAHDNLLQALVVVELWQRNNLAG